MPQLSSLTRVNFHLKPSEGTLENIKIDHNFVYFFAKDIVPLTGKDEGVALVPNDGILVGKANQVLLLRFGEATPRGDPAFLEVNPSLYMYALVSAPGILGAGDLSPIFAVLSCFKRIEIPEDMWLVRISM
jgi:hypothetical protein